METSKKETKTGAVAQQDVRKDGKPRRRGRTIRVKEMLQLLWSHRFIVLFFFVLIVSITLIYTVKSPKIYRAATKLEIKGDTVDLFATSGRRLAVDTSSIEYFRTQYSKIKSRTVAENVIALRRLKVPDPKTGQERPMRTSELLNKLKVQPDRDTRLVNLYVEDTDPERAAVIANDIVDEFIRYNVEREVKERTAQVQAIQKELDSYRASVEEAERAFNDFKQRHKVVSIDKTENLVLSQLEAATKAATDVGAERAAAELTYEQIKNLPIEELKTRPEIEKDTVFQQLKVNLDNASRMLSEASHRYGQKHPIYQEKDKAVTGIQQSIDKRAEEVREQMRLAFVTAQEKERKAAEAQNQARQQVLEFNTAVRAQYQSLEMVLQTKQATYKEGLQKVTEGGVESRVSRAPTAWEPGTSNIGIVDRAVPSNRPVRPRPLINMALAIFIGLSLGCGSAFLIDYVNDKVKNPDDVTVDLGQRLLAEIPEPMERKHTRLGTRLVKLELTPAETGTLVHTRPRLAVSEAYRSLRASISLLERERPLRCLLVTSAAKGEGKTTTATNLAIALAKEGKNVVIVDTDLRRPTVHTYFGIHDGHRNGLYGCLMGKLRLEDAITSKSEMAQLAEPAIQEETREEKRRKARRLLRRQVTQWNRNRSVLDAQVGQGRNLPGQPEKGTGQTPSTLLTEKACSYPTRALPQREQTEKDHYEWLLRDTASEPLWLESWRAESLLLDNLCELSAVDVVDPEMSDRLAIRGPASVARLSLADGSTRILVVGDDTEDGAHRYARIEGESAVYLVPKTDFERVFRSDSDLRESIRSHGELAILPCGARRIRMPTEVITSPGMEKVIAELKKRFDVVILDSPPCQFSDPLLLAKYVDGIVVVVQARKYAKSMIEQGLDQLDKLEGEDQSKVLGVALNRFDPRKSGGYGHYGYRSYYYYRYYYGRYYYYYGTGVRHHGFFSYFYKPSRRCGGLLPKRMKEHRVHKIEIQPPGQGTEPFVLHWGRLGWACPVRYNHPANSSRVESFLEQIRRLHGRKVKKVRKHEDVGLGKGQAVRVALHDSGGKPILTLLLGETRDTSRRRLFFKVEGRRTVYRADRDLLGMLRIQSSDEAAKSPPDGRGLLDLNVIRTSSQEVVAVELEIRGKDGQPDQHVELRRKDTTDLEVDPLRTVQVVKLAGNLTKQSARASVAAPGSIV